jgi:hypothetical protein
MPQRVSRTRLSSTVFGVLLCAALTAATGCRYVATQAFAEVRGAQAEIHTPAPVHSSAFERFRDVEFDPARSDFGERMIPRALLRAYDDAGIEAIGKLRDRFPGGQPVVRIATEILYFQSKSLMGGAEALARVHFSDGSSSIFDSIIRAESESFRAGDEAALARAIMDAIVRLLRGTAESSKSE